MKRRKMGIYKVPSGTCTLQRKENGGFAIPQKILPPGKKGYGSRDHRAKGFVGFGQHGGR